MALEDEQERLRIELAAHPINGSFTNGSLADYYDGIVDAMRAVGLTERKAPVEVEGLAGELESMAATMDSHTRLGIPEHLRKEHCGFWRDKTRKIAATLQSQATELATLKQQLAEREEALSFLEPLHPCSLGVLPPQDCPMAYGDPANPFAHSCCVLRQALTDGGDQ